MSEIRVKAVDLESHGKAVTEAVSKCGLNLAEFALVRVRLNREVLGADESSLGDG